MRLMRGAVTQAQDPARVRLRPKWHPNSLKGRLPHRVTNRMKSVAPLGPGRSDRLLTGLYVLAVCMIGCSTQQIPVPVNSAPIEAAPTSNLAEGNLAGLWTGTTSTGGLLGSAGETRNIKFDLRQVGDQITGSYRCSGGN